MVKLIILCLTLYCCDRVTNCDEIISEYVNSVYKKHIYGGFALLKLMSVSSRKIQNVFLLSIRFFFVSDDVASISFIIVKDIGFMLTL